MLYPTTYVNLVDMTPLYRLESGSLLVIRLTLPAASALLFSMVHLAPTQDYSLRGWFSLLPCGDFLPNNIAYWCFERVNDRRIALYDQTAVLPDGLGNIYPLPVPPGQAYCLNILNLVNAENVFSFAAALVVC